MSLLFGAAANVAKASDPIGLAPELTKDFAAALDHGECPSDPKAASPACIIIRKRSDQGSLALTPSFALAGVSSGPVRPGLGSGRVE